LTQLVLGLIITSANHPSRQTRAIMVETLQNFDEDGSFLSLHFTFQAVTLLILHR